MTLRVSPEGPLTSSNTAVALRAVEGGAGYLYLFEDYVRDALDAGRLISVLNDWCPSFRDRSCTIRARLTCRRACALSSISCAASARARRGPRVPADSRIVRIALLGPGVAAVVIAADFPEAGMVRGGELDPLAAISRSSRNRGAARPAAPARRGRAGSGSPSQLCARMASSAGEILEREVGGVAVIAGEQDEAAPPASAARRPSGRASRRRPSGCRSATSW